MAKQVSVTLKSSVNTMYLNVLQNCLVNKIQTTDITHSKRNTIKLKYKIRTLKIKYQM